MSATKNCEGPLVAKLIAVVASVVLLILEGDGDWGAPVDPLNLGIATDPTDDALSPAINAAQVAGRTPVVVARMIDEVVSVKGYSTTVTVSPLLNGSTLVGEIKT